MSEVWTKSGVKLPYQDGDSVDYKGAASFIDRGWVRDVDLTGYKPIYKIFNNGMSVWATADDLELRDTNPHPGYEHWAAFCPNCGH